MTNDRSSPVRLPRHLGWRLIALVGVGLFATVNLRWLDVWSVSLPLAPYLAAAAACVVHPRARLVLERFLAALDGAGWRFVVVLAVTHFVMASVVCHGCFAGVPNVEDGYSYFLQAKLFSQGQVDVPVAVGNAFVSPWIVWGDGRLFSIFPPGFPALAAPAFWVGAPSLAPAVHGALGVVAAWAFAREVVGRARANAVAFLCAASPWALVMSASFMSHPAMLACTYGAGYFALRALRAPRWGLTAAGAGALIGLGFLVRPAEGVATALALVVSALAFKGRRALPRVAVAALVASWGPLVYLVYNHRLLGVWWRDPLSVVEPAVRYGFGPTIGAVWPDTFPTVGHTLGRAALNANYNLAVLSSDAFGWPISSLTFALLAIFLGRRGRAWWAAAPLCTLVVAVYAGYWYHGVCLGARFYYSLLPAIALLTVEGVSIAVAGAARVAEGVRAPLRAFAVALVAAMVFGGLALYLPRALAVTPYPSYRGFRSNLLDEAARLPPGPAIVFVHGTYVHAATLVMRNEWPPDRGRVIYARDLGVEANQRFVQHYPGRAVYHLTYRPPPNPVADFLHETFGAGLMRPR